MKALFSIFNFLLWTVKSDDNGFSITPRKCCDQSEILDLVSNKCIDNQETISKIPLMVKNVTTQTIQYNASIDLEFSSKFKLKCDPNHRETFKFDLYDFGSKEKRTWIILATHSAKISSVNDVCFDKAVNLDTKLEYYVAQKCHSCTEEHPCLNFCCGDHFKQVGDECVESDKPVPKQYEEINFTYVNTNLFCDTTKLKRYSSIRWSLSDKGIIIDNYDEYHLNSYCVNFEDQSVLVCTEKRFEDRRLAKVIIMSISVVCILIVMSLNVVIDELRNSQIASIKIPFCFFLAFSFIIVVISSCLDNSVLNSSTCTTLGLLLQFSVLSTFFWLTCLSFDVWLRFRKLQDPGSVISMNNFYYCISIICPTIITIITLILQTISTPEDANYIHPKIGENSCQLGEPEAQFYYFHLVIIILLGLNVLLFMAMITVLIQGPWQLCRGSSNTPPSMSVLQVYRIFLELFFLMGVNWISESASFFVQWLSPTNWNHKSLFILEIINWSIGIILFILFFCKENNRYLVMEFIFPDSESKSGETSQPTALRSSSSRVSYNSDDSTGSGAELLSYRSSSNRHNS